MVPQSLGGGKQVVWLKAHSLEKNLYLELPGWPWTRGANGWLALLLLFLCWQENNAISEKEEKYCNFPGTKRTFKTKKKNAAMAYFGHIVFIYLPASNMLHIDIYNAIPDFISILEVILHH